MAQLSENPEIKRFYDHIFSEAGSEIYLKPVSYYFTSFPIQVTFADIINAAQKRDEICLGVRLNKNADKPEKNFGIQLNPGKTEAFNLAANDSLVVFSDNEL